MGKRKLGGSSLLGREPDTYILPTTTTPGVAIVSTSVPGVFVGGTMQSSSGADWNAAVGAAGEILNKPTIPPAQVNANWAATSGVEQVLNKPVVAVNSLTVSSTTGGGGPTSRDIVVTDSDGTATTSTLPVPLIPWVPLTGFTPTTTSTSGEMALSRYNVMPTSAVADRVVVTSGTIGTFNDKVQDLPQETTEQTVVTTGTAGEFGVQPYNTMPQSTFAGRVIATSATEGTFELRNDDLILPLPTSYNSNKIARMWNKNGFVVKGDPDDPVTDVTVSAIGANGPTSRDIVVTDSDGTATTSTLPVPLIPWSTTADQVPVTSTTTGEMTLKRYDNLPTSSGTDSLVKTGGAIGTFHLADAFIKLPPATTHNTSHANRWWNNSGFICVGNTGEPIKNVSLNSAGTTLTTLKFDGNQTSYTLLPNVPPLIQHGEIFVGNTTNAGYSIFNVTFANGYTSKPTLIFNAHQGGAARNSIVDVYGTNITTSGFSANLYDSSTTGADVVIHWMAMGS